MKFFSYILMHTKKLKPENPLPMNKKSLPSVRYFARIIEKREFNEKKMFILNFGIQFSQKKT
jgi:hypothetical protein